VNLKLFEMSSFPLRSKNWFYVASDGISYGPCSPAYMYQNYSDGFFTESLPIKMEGDRDFHKLGDCIRACGNKLPFHLPIDSMDVLCGTNQESNRDQFGSPFPVNVTQSLMSGFQTAPINSFNGFVDQGMFQPQSSPALFNGPMMSTNMGVNYAPPHFQTMQPPQLVPTCDASSVYQITQTCIGEAALTESSLDNLI